MMAPIAAPARADYMYTYTGPDFAEISRGVGAYARGVYLPTDRVTGTLVIAEDGWNKQGVSPKSLATITTLMPYDYSFTDGHQVLTPLNSVATFFATTSPEEGLADAFLNLKFSIRGTTGSMSSDPTPNFPLGGDGLQLASLIDGVSFASKKTGGPGGERAIYEIQRVVEPSTILLFALGFGSVLVLVLFFFNDATPTKISPFPIHGIPLI